MIFGTYLCQLLDCKTSRSKFSQSILKTSIHIFGGRYKSKISLSFLTQTGTLVLIKYEGFLSYSIESSSEKPFKAGSLNI